MKLHSISALSFILFPCAAMAQITLQIDPLTPVAPIVTAGSSFSLNLQLDNQTGTGVAGYDIDVESLVYNVTTNAYAPASNDFSLTGVTLTSPVLNLPNSTLPTSTSPVPLDPQAGSSSQPLDFGASNLFTGETVGSGVSPLETVSFQVASAATPGIYELEFFAMDGNAQGAPTISDDEGNSIGTAGTPLYSDSFTVVSAPEPSAAMFLMMAALVLAPVMAFRRLSAYFKSSPRYT